MKKRFLDSVMGVLAASGLMLAGWGIITAPDEAGRDLSAWGWSWSIQNQQN